MSKKLAFDTLEFATLLRTGGVEKADTHAASLSTVITQNLYVKDEADKMIEAALAKSDALLTEFKLEMERDRARQDKAMLELENRSEKNVSRSIYTAFAIFGTLITAITTIATFINHFPH